MTSTDASRRRKRLVASREIDARQDVARHDLATALARITSPTVLGRRWMTEATISYHGAMLEIVSPVLDMADVGVLLALLCVAARKHTSEDGEMGAGLSRLLPPELPGRTNLAREVPCAVVTCTVHELASILGRNTRDGPTARAIRRSLVRLGQVVMTTTKGGSWAATHLLHAAQERRGQLKVALNYRATHVLTGAGQYAAISMVQWRRCTPVQRAVMYRLSVLSTGRLVNVGIETLVAACWATPAPTAKALQRRKERVRAAIRSAAAVPRGVCASVDHRDVVRLSRPVA